MIHLLAILFLANLLFGIGTAYVARAVISSTSNVALSTASIVVSGFFSFVLTCLRTKQYGSLQISSIIYLGLVLVSALLLPG